MKNATPNALRAALLPRRNANLLLQIKWGHQKGPHQPSASRRPGQIWVSRAAPLLLRAKLLMVQPLDCRKRVQIISISCSAQRLSSIWACKAWTFGDAAEGSMNRLTEF